ncbi:hypothetical protein ACFQ0M_04215 [Kitasatospora aburaviensis]
MKFYGTWGDAEAAQRTLLARDWRAEGYAVDEDTIAGARVVRLNRPAAPAPSTAPRSAPRRLALDLLPPIATRAVRRACGRPAPYAGAAEAGRRSGRVFGTPRAQGGARGGRPTPSVGRPSPVLRLAPGAAVGTATGRIRPLAGLWHQGARP